MRKSNSAGNKNARAPVRALGVHVGCAQWLWRRLTTGVIHTKQDPRYVVILMHWKALEHLDAHGKCWSISLPRKRQEHLDARKSAVAFRCQQKC